MRSKPIIGCLIVVAIVALMSRPARAQGGILWNQPYDGSSPGVPSQVFTDTDPLDYTNYNTQAFDDFKVTGNGWIVTGATFYGYEPFSANPAESVNMQFMAAPGPATSDAISGTEDDSGNLNFNGLNVYLAPGTYWIAAWVTRPELSDGQWFWNMTNYGSPVGSEFYIQNEDGGLLQDGSGNPLALTPTPGSLVFGTQPSDLAFTIYGQQAAVPEPSSLVLLVTSLVGLLGYARTRRERAVA